MRLGGPRPSAGQGVARGETRGDVVRRVAEACLVGGSAWTCSTLGAAAKAPVMKLPDGKLSTLLFFSIRTALVC